MSARAVPFHCPYCGEENLFPHETDEGYFSLGAMLQRAMPTVVRDLPFDAPADHATWPSAPTRGGNAIPRPKSSAESIMRSSP